jgi:hypothetical protein
LSNDAWEIASMGKDPKPTDEFQGIREDWAYGPPEREEIWQPLNSYSCKHYGGKAFWSVGECVALAMGREPVNDWDELFRTGQFRQELSEMWSDIETAHDKGDLPERIRPTDFIAWAREQEINIPRELEEAVALNQLDINELRDRIRSLLADNQQLLREHQRLRDELARLQSSSTPPEVKEVTPKERTSLHQLLIAMVRAHYKWDPMAERSPETQKIVGAVKKYTETTIDPQTVLRHLRAAHGEFPPPKKE